MARKTPPDRLPQLIACATTVFIDQGYRRTQMDEVAAALGVAKGTLYLYVESKEALFDLVVRCADAEPPLPQFGPLPLPSPKSGATLSYVRERLAQNQTLPALTAALARAV
jgi:AcrR family transcriptional regulator